MSSPTSPASDRLPLGDHRDQKILQMVGADVGFAPQPLRHHIEAAGDQNQRREVNVGLQRILLVQQCPALIGHHRCQHLDQIAAAGPQSLGGLRFDEHRPRRGSSAKKPSPVLIAARARSTGSGALASIAGSSASNARRLFSLTSLAGVRRWASGSHNANATRFSTCGATSDC